MFWKKNIFLKELYEFRGRKEKKKKHKLNRVFLLITGLHFFLLGNKLKQMIL